MQAVFLAALPFFALVGLGYAAARSGLLPAAAVPGLNVFTLYFALPALLLRLGSGGSLLAGLNLAALAVYAAAALGIVVLAGWAARREQLRLDPVDALATRRDSAFVALAAAFPNSGFLGLPLLIGLLGPQAAGPIASTLVVDLFFTSSICLAWSQPADAAHPLPRRLLGSLLPALRNPLPWSIAVGTGLGWAGVAPTGVLTQTLDMLGHAATPVALFALGAMLDQHHAARAQASTAATAADPAPAHPGPGGRPPGRSAGVRAGVRILWPVALKLVAHPALVAGIGWLAWHEGRGSWQLSPQAWLALSLTAALPCAGNVGMLAQRHGADAARIARLIVISTVAGMLAFTLWAGVLMRLA